MWGMIALGAIQAGSQIYSGWKQKEAAEENAKLMREQASFQRDQYDDQASTMQTQSNAVLGGQRNAMARSGVKTDQGSPLSLLRANEKALNKDIGRTRQAGQHAYDTGMNQANSLEQQGQDAFTASLIGGATSFAGTLANNVNIPTKTTSPSPYGKNVTDSPSLSPNAPNTNSWTASSVGLGGYNGSYTGMFDQEAKLQQPSYMNQGMTGNMINNGLGSGNNYGYGNYNYKKYLPKKMG